MIKHYSLKKLWQSSGNIFLLLVLFHTSVIQAQNHSHNISAELNELLNYYEKKIYFTENKGQWETEILFRADLPSGKAVASPSGILLAVYDAADLAARSEQGFREEQAFSQGENFNEKRLGVRGHAWMLRFLNSSPSMRVEGELKHDDVFHYFPGNKEKHRTDVRNFGEIWYRNVYDGVDVRFYPSASGDLEYDMICLPGFNKEKIVFKLEGISEVEKTAEGSLKLKTTVGDMILPSPVSYQKINGQYFPVESEYIVSASGEISFALGKFDVAQPLIIDPIALRWATWINSNSTNDNHGHCIWVDETEGSIYIANRLVGTTDNITPGALYDTTAGGIETVVGKYMEPSTIGGAGTRLWQTYIGGFRDDNPYAMEMGSDGNIYITGTTNSPDFPLLGGTGFSGISIDNRNESGINIYVLKINAQGNSVKSAVIGGDSNDSPYDLRISADGDVLVGGTTNSNNLGSLHPGTGATNSSMGNDVLIFRLNQNLSTLSWMRNYGGSGNDQARIMLFNTYSNDIYLAGFTQSSDFPVVNPRQNYQQGTNRNGFLQKLKGDGTTVWSSYFNSEEIASSTILCMEFNSNFTRLYFGGITTGLHASNISQQGVFDNTYNGGNNDFFVALIDTAQNFVGATYLGGINNESNMMGMNVDQNNDVYVFGYSNSFDFPVTADALQDTIMGGSDKIFVKIAADLGWLKYSTFYGGTQEDYDPVGERGIKFSNCRIYTIVTARSSDIPLTEGAITEIRLSMGNYEPGLVVWANPPDLTNNNIFDNQTICAGTLPSDIFGTEPDFSLPNISRNGVISPYPVSGGTITYQWQSSSDNVNWTDIPGATGQHLPASQIGVLYSQTFFRRIISGDACVIEGLSGQIVTVNIPEINATINNITCTGENNGSILANVDFGTPPYSYTWSNGTTNQNLTNLAPGTYTLSISDGAGCNATQGFSIEEPELITVSATITGGDCMSGINVNATVLGGTAPYQFLWHPGGETSPNITAMQTGEYVVTVTDGNNCPPVTASVFVQIGSLTPPEITANGPLEFCENESVTLTASTTGSVNYQWYANGELLPNQNNSTILVNAAGTYYVEISNAGCSAQSQEITVSIGELPHALVSPSALICPGDSVVLTASGGEYFLWSNGETTSSIVVSPTQNTSYSVEVSNPVCDEISFASTVVSLAPEPAATIVITGVPTLGNPVHFSNLSGDSNIISWFWDFGDGTSSTVPSPYHTYAPEGSYTIILSVENEFGCENSDTLEIEVTQIISIPNILSPNGDGINDAFFIGNNGAEEYLISIYNRWGALIFENAGKGVSWDGRTKAGEPVSEGTYFYILHVRNSGSLGDFKQAGFITIVR